MPCGHTCGACPTKSTCHLHDAIDEHGEAKNADIEDMYLGVPVGDGAKQGDLVDAAGGEAAVTVSVESEDAAEQQAEESSAGAIVLEA